MDIDIDVKEQAHALKNWPSRTWSLNRYIVVAMVGVIGIVLSLAGFIVLWNRQSQEMQDHFKNHAENRASTIQRNLENHLRALRSIGDFFSASRNVDRREFWVFVKDHLSENPGIQALEWSPRVLDSERRTYEEAVQKEGFPDFQIIERSSEGEMIRALGRDEYFPVRYVEPYKGNETVLGFDLASNHARLQGLQRARDLGIMVATKRVTLVQETGEQFGFLVYLPIYRQNVPLNSVEDRRKNLTGFALAVFRIGDLVEKSLTYVDPGGIGIDTYLYDESASTDERFLYSYQSPLREWKIPTKGRTELLDGMHVLKTIDVAGRKWSILCSPIPKYLATKKSWPPWFVLGSGLFLTVLLVCYLRTTLVYTSKIENSANDLNKEITERARAEEEVLQANQELKEATVQLVQSEKLSALGELTAGVAHELNQPLNGIKIICQSLLRDIRRNRFEVEALEPDLNDVVTQVNKMAEIIDHMRIYTRRSEGKPKEKIDVNQVVEGALKFQGQHLKNHNIEVVQELREDMPQVIGDEIRLEQVLVNLITNARGALEDSGKAHRSIEIKTYQSVADPPAIVMEVSDNGLGIPEDLREKIFQPFFTTKAPGKGTGLGLHVVSQIIEEHNGRIEVSSQAGEGTTFRVNLPIANSI